MRHHILNTISCFNEIRNIAIDQYEEAKIQAKGGEKLKSQEEEDKEKDSIGPLKLFAQISHSRDEKLGVVLKASVLNIREMETVKADILGAATVDVYEEVSVGQLNIQPV